MRNDKMVLHQEKISWSEIGRVWIKSAARRYYRTRNSIRNGMWPTSVNNLYLSCILFYLLMLTEPSCLAGLNQRLWRLAHWLASDLLHVQLADKFVALPVAIGAGFLSMCVVMLARQLAIRALLSYRGWMYTSMRSPPLQVKLWALIVRLLSGYRPSLYSFQRSLPRMPVPSVNQTIGQLCKSMECIMEPDEFKDFERKAREFESKLAPKLQRLLILKSWLTQNYVSDWWTKYVYLMTRLPLANNCNYYIMDQSYWRATDKPVARAASLVANLLRFKQLIDREELPPLVLRDTIPICMSQYEQLYSTTRVPHEEFDELVHYESSVSRHIIVVCRGVYYKLNCYDCQNNPLSSKRLEEHIQFLVEDAEKSSHLLSEEERTISGLTALDRKSWSSLRLKLQGNKVNREALHLVESAMFCLWIFEDEKLDDLSARAKIAFQGSKDYRLWFDKCFNVVVFGDGHCGLNCEHTLCDAPAFAHMWEYTLCKDVLECTFDSDGCCFPPLQTHKEAASERPTRITWDVRAEGQSLAGEQPTSLDVDIRKANELAKVANDDVDLKIFDHSQWGKGVIKKCGVSPDAFVQLAIQMAYYKMNKKFVQTYEASMTRLYLNGRTETVRACTSESCEFVKAMISGSSKREELIRLLKCAADKHTILYKDAMNGKGIDRHLFALYVASRGLGYDCKFLGDLLTRPWVLSTSQTPHTQQTNVPDPNYQDFNHKLCSGGGFMAVAEHGYGISYLFPSDQKIFFHITSRHSSPDTDTSRFGELLFESLDQIRDLFSEV